MRNKDWWVCNCGIHNPIQIYTCCCGETKANLNVPEKMCCHHLPVHQHCKTCDDDARGDEEYHARKDNE